MDFLTNDYKIVNQLKKGMIIKGYNDQYLIKDIQEKNIFIQRVNSYDKTIICTIPAFLMIDTIVKRDHLKKMFYLTSWNKQKRCFDYIYGATVDKTLDTFKSFIKIYNN